MNEKELRELFCDMQMKGLSPLICDTKVPFSARFVLAKSITKSCSWARTWHRRWDTAIPVMR